MCLMLYMATHGGQPRRNSPELSVEEVEPSREAVRQWFSLPVVRFIGAHTGCSCGFPHVVGDEPVEYWAGMFGDQDREADLRSVESLLVLGREHVQNLHPRFNSGRRLQFVLGNRSTVACCGSPLVAWTHRWTHYTAAAPRESDGTSGNITQIS
jgi:hypothetical protein